MIRQVKFNSDSVSNFNDLMEETEGKLREAIGYLSTWNMSAYSHVSISIDPKEKELVARYSLGDDHIIGYVIGAIWDELGKRFSFHS